MVAEVSCLKGVIVKIGLIWALVLAAVWPLQVFAGADAGGWNSLGFEKTELAGATVYYEKSLKEHLPTLGQAYARFVADMPMRKRLLAQKDRILPEINRMLGITEPQTRMQEQMLERMVVSISTEGAVFYLTLQSTVKDHMRGGGALPDHEYHKPTDTVSYQPSFISKGLQGNTAKIDLAVEVKAESAAKDIEVIFEALQTVMGGGGIALHEVVEMSLIMRAKPGDPHWRWFTDGAANAITCRLLSKFIDDDTAKAYLESFDSSQYGDIENEVNLRQWMNAAFSIETPVEKDLRLVHARYAYATLEIGLLARKHGIECIKKILDEVCTGPGRTSRDLHKAIDKVTGTAIGERLDRYQSFTTTAQATTKYAQAYKKALAAKDYETMLANILRLMEVRDSQYSETGLTDRRNAALLLCKCGHEAAGDQVMADCIDIFGKSPIPDGRYAAMETFIMYALDIRKPEKALAVAKEMLAKSPKHVLSMTVVMLTDAMDGRYADAQVQAKIIQEVANEKSQSYLMAGKILEVDPSSPPPVKNSDR